MCGRLGCCMAICGCVVGKKPCENSLLAMDCCWLVLACRSWHGECKIARSNVCDKIRERFCHNPFLGRIVFCQKKAKEETDE